MFGALHSVLLQKHTSKYLAGFWYPVVIHVFYISKLFNPLTP